MARKGREPLVEAPPPAASSSSGEEDEDEDSSSDDEQQPPPLSQPPAEQSHSPSSSSESEEEEEEEEEDGDGDEDEDEEEDEQPKQNSASSPPKKKPGLPKPAETDSGSDSDSDVPPPPKKPTMEAAKPKKSKPKPPASSPPPVTVLAVPAPVSAQKRRGSETDKGSTPKKAKKEKAEATKTPLTQDEVKKPLFQRLWSEGDEIAILQGFIDFKAKKCVDPMADGDAFVEFVKKSLHVDVNKGQIMGKIRTLKKRFETALKRKKITDPHGLRLFELSKKIWESDEVKSNGVVDGKDSNLMSPNIKKRAKSDEKLKGGKNQLVLEVAKKDDGEERGHELVVSRGEMELQFEDLANFGLLRDGILKEGLKLLGDEEKARLDEKWREQNMAEMEVYLKRLDLVRELTEKTLNAMKSAEH